VLKVRGPLFSAVESTGPSRADQKARASAAGPAFDQGDGAASHDQYGTTAACIAVDIRRCRRSALLNISADEEIAIGTSAEVAAKLAGRGVVGGHGRCAIDPGPPSGNCGRPSEFESFSDGGHLATGLLDCPHWNESGRIQRLEGARGC